jgi:hypothetical protein
MASNLAAAQADLRVDPGPACGRPGRRLILTLSLAEKENHEYSYATQENIAELD